ncbi:sialic acid-binding Ig-like lectin 14 [Erethizon dorsatum]
MLALLLLTLLWAGSLQQYPQYRLQVQESVTVQEGLCVLVPCSFSFPWSVWSSSEEFYMSWFRVSPRPQDHNTNLTCQVKLGGTQVTTEKTIRLNVSSLKTLSNGSALSLLEEQFLRLVCEADSNPPAFLSWFQKGKAPSPSQVSASGVLELSRVGTEDGGGFTCQAQHPLGTQHFSLSLSVQRSPSSCICEAEKQEGSWPLALTIIRGTLMGAGFLLTYGLTWIYYTR